MKFSLILPTMRYGAGATASSIEKNTKDYEIIYVGGNKGFNKKLNEGIEKATGDYIVLLHDDCEVLPGWLDHLPEHVGSFCLGENDDFFETWGGFISPPSYCNDPKLTPDYSYWLCFTREVADKIAPLDERFKNPIYQDVDLGLTVRKAGYTIECLPGKIIHHNGEGSGTQDELQRGYLNRKWNIHL